MKKTAAVGLGTFALAVAFAAKDPVIMTVGGEKVPKSEFEYLYNKNAEQQVNQQTIEEYAELFKLYKMKVADARAAGIDTVSKFKREMEEYRHDLAKPYLADSTFFNNFADECVECAKEEVVARHIMLFKTRDPKTNRHLREKADSLLGVLKAGADFAEVARAESQDRSSKSRGGLMGWIVAGNFPVEFEEVAYNLGEGKLSNVVETPMGYHILLGGKHRPARGKVQVQHILKLTQGKDEAGQAKALQQIDSLYNVVIANPESFSEVASKNSEDPGSARQGGMLPLFGTGEMVAEFDSVSFALPDGAISKPVKTAYGYHIIKKIGSQGPNLNAFRSQQIARMSSPQDPRHAKIRKQQNDKLAKRHKGSLDAKTIAMLEAKALNSGIDSLFVVSLSENPMPLAKVEGEKYSTADLAPRMKKFDVPAGENAVEALNSAIDAFYNTKLVYAEEDYLLKTEPDYRNLLKEYVDGSLLYEISVQKVWDRAAKDTEGLEKFFEANRDNYKWTEPHAKGYLVQAPNDSVAEQIKIFAAGIEDNTEKIFKLREEFKNVAQFDRVLVTKGTNAMVDNLMFGGDPVTPQSQKYTVYFMLEPRVIMEPEDVSDVKGMVTSDYQNEFQNSWEAELKAKYPAVVNEKVLKSVSRKKN
ncbi:MAG: peptidylprolyl isomerase [Muribaculaceae bacterium]|nr:peptidylprolyl isomerase [Muribaculaceae bacterium]